MLIAESYIGSAEFWNTVISGVIGIVVGVAAAAIGYRAQNPKRRILWEEHSNQSLVPATASGAPSPVTISVGGLPHPLPEARLIELKVRNAGRKDVKRDDFTMENDSLVFDFGVPVVAVVDVATDPPSAPTPGVDLNGTQLKVQKSPILRGQEIAFSVLVNGPQWPVKIANQSILDTPVKGTNRDQREKVKFAVGGALFIILLVLTTFYSFSSSSPLGIIRKYNHLEDCRFWDTHDPARAKKECPEIKKP